jgi:hypothetical protein
MGDFTPRYQIPALGRELTPDEDLLLRDWAGDEAQGEQNLTQTGEKRERIVDAEIIRWALFGKAHDTTLGQPFLVSESGAHAKHVFTIRGDLDLTALRFEKPISLTGCTFLGNIVLEEARIGSLALAGCAIPRIYAKNVRIEGDWDLSSAVIRDYVYAIDARVDGGLYMHGTTLKAAAKFSDRWAIFCQRAKIEGSVHVRKGFIANAETDFSGAYVGGQLDCSGGHFLNSGGRALGLAAATIDGDVFLSDKFRAEGSVELNGANLGGHLFCFDCSFINPEKSALNCDSIKVDATLYLATDFKAEGLVNLRAAKIGGQLNCHGGEFKNPGRMALNCGLVETQTDVYLRQGFKAEGSVSLIAARIGGGLDCSKATFLSKGQVALDATSMTVASDAFLNNGFHAEGLVSLMRATFGGQLHLESGHFDNGDEIALSAESAAIASDVFCFDVEVVGEVNFISLNVGGDLLMRGAKFLPVEGQKKKHNGSLDLTSASIRGTLYLTGLPNVIARVNLTGAHAHGFADDGHAWRDGECGCVRLDGFTYDALVDDEFRLKPEKTLVSARDRIAWLKKQPRDMWTSDLRPQPWAQIAKVLSAMGHDDGARAILAERAFLRLANWPWRESVVRPLLARAFLPFALVFAGFGYYPLRSVFWLLGLWIFGIWVALQAYDDGMIMPVPDRWAQAKTLTGEPKPYPTFDACSYAFDITVPVIPVDAKNYWMPNDRDAPWSGAPDAVRPRASHCWFGQWVHSLVPSAKTLWENFPTFSGEKYTWPRDKPWFDAGLVQFWANFQTLFGWLFATIAVAGLTGLLRRGEE